MRKKTAIIVASICLGFFALFSVITIIGYITGENDISFPIGFGIFALIAGYDLYLFIKDKEFFLERLRLKRVLKYYRSEKEDKSSIKLGNYLNSRHKLFIKICPVCGKTSSRPLTDRPCRRCKTLFSKDTEKFTLECKGISKHRLASFYSQDYNKLKSLIALYNPHTNVTDSSSGGDSININITITHN